MSVGSSCSLTFSLTGWQKIFSRTHFIIAKRMRRSEFLGLKTNCRTILVLRSEVWTWPTDYLAFVSMYYVVGFSSQRLFIWKWNVYVEVELAMAGSITFRKPGTRAVSLWTFPSLGIVLSSLYLMMTSRQVISTVFPSNGLANEHFEHTASMTLSSSSFAHRGTRSHRSKYLFLT